MPSTDYFGLRNVIYRPSEPKITYSRVKDAMSGHKFSGYSKEGVSSFFYFRYPILTNTMFEDYKRLDTGYSDETQSYYWKPNFKAKEISLADAAARLDGLLITSVKKLIAGSARVGISLSGGLDSSLIAAVINRHFPNKELFTYSLGFENLHEFEYSDEVAGLLASRHSKIIILKGDFLKEKSIMEGLIQEKCAPVHPNEIALAMAELQAKGDGCDILLSGEGADEVFGGYGQILRMYLNYAGSKYKDFCEYFLSNYSYFSPAELREIVDEKYYLDDYELLKPVFSEPECPEELENKVPYFLQRVHGRGMIERADNSFKYCGIKGGFPYIDENLVSFVNSLPFNYKVRWKDGVDVAKASALSFRDISETYDIPKYILKLVAQKYLPERIVYRKKIAFPVPFHEWFSDLESIHLDKEIFKIKDIRRFSGWKKFMIYNLNSFFNIFNEYKG